MKRIHMYTTFDIGQMTGTDPTTVHKWIDRGLVKGFRTPGGHRRVTAKDLKAFLVAHGMPIPDELRDSTEVRLMLVDDDVALLTSLSKAIKKARPNWDVECCTDAYRALILVPTFMPTALVVDVMMPGLNGSSLIKTVKARVPTLHLYAASAKAAPEVERKAVLAGATAFLKKPLVTNTLIEILERAHDIPAPLEPARF